MTKLIFITHPAVKVDREVDPRKWELSAEGKTDLHQLIDKSFWKDVDAIYASPEHKAYIAAKLASEKFGIELKTEKDLTEINRDSTKFLPFDLYMRVIETFYAHPSESYQGWERANDAQERIVNCVKNIMNDHAGETVAIIGHGATGTLLKCFIKDVELSLDEDPEGTAFIFEADWDTKKILKDWYKY